MHSIHKTQNMKWFDGSVGEAVVKAKHRKSFFVVYIEGVDRLSETMTSVINSEDISKILETGNYVCVRVKFGSREYQEFVEIYKHVPVPSLFLIGVNGIPLAVVTNSIDQDVASLHDQILEAIVLKDKYRRADNSFALLSANKTDSDIGTASMAVSAHLSSTSEITNIEKETDDVSMQVTPVASSNTYDLRCRNSQKDESAVAKKSYTIGRVFEEGNCASQQVTHTDVDHENDNEVTNINESENITDKPTNEDDESKLSKNNSQNRVQSNSNDDIRVQEIYQEKLRNELDRKRVLNDIAMDKQERVAWQQEMRATSANKTDSKGPERCEQTPLSGNQTRIQFRKSNGATYTEVFDVRDMLLELQRYVIQNVQMQSSQFQLATAFPRHVFTETEYVKTLKELNLVPNAVILIIPLSEDNSSGSYIYSQLSNTFWLITSPITGLYRSIVGDSAVEQPHTVEEAQRRPAEASAHQSDTSNQQRNSSQQSASSRRNVFTIEDINKDNNNKDRNDVWNGNSTQQIQ